MIFKFSILLHVLAISTQSLCAEEYFVSSAREIKRAMLSAQPGDHLVMKDGTWTDQIIEFAGFGQKRKPITLRADTPGKVILNGSSTLEISGDWLIVEGLRFEGGALSHGNVVKFTGPKGDATNSRLTNSAIVNYNPKDVNTRYHWISLYGEHNRVDHNYFEGQNHSGVTVVVSRNDASPDYHRIDNNYFAKRPRPIKPKSTNGFETIRVGSSDFALSDSYTIVENNLFEHTDGEIEIISSKSGKNIYRHNTFREAKGTLTLRSGNNNLVEGNFFLGNNVMGTGGIRVIGAGHRIINNYIANVHHRAGGAISITAGVPDSKTFEYLQVKDVVIAHNTIVDVQSPSLTFDSGIGSSSRTLLADKVTIANNLFKSIGTQFFAGREGKDWIWKGNIVHGGDSGSKSNSPGIVEIDPKMTLEEDLWRIGPNSPAIDSAVGNYKRISKIDMDGQRRKKIADVGADEFSQAKVVHKPLYPKDVGTDWYSNTKNNN